MDNALPRLLTPTEVAEWLGETRARVMRLARQGKIPHVQLPGGGVMFDQGLLKVWLESCRRGEVAHA
jgi:excisionase family DNA binding protein